MADVEREKYVRIMDEIEELEDRVDELKKTGGGNDQSKAELAELQNRLAERMKELARITDGCSRPGASGR